MANTTLFSSYNFLSPFSVLEFANIPCKVAGSVPTGSGDGELTLEDHVSRADRRVMSRSTCYSLIAASEALKQAGWAPDTEDQRCYTGNLRDYQLYSFEPKIQYHFWNEDSI